MSESMQNAAKEVSNVITRFRFKKSHDLYRYNYILYSDYKNDVFLFVNNVRKDRGNEPFSKEKFDEAWQYRTMAHENWKIARNEIINTILGWW